MRTLKFKAQPTNAFFAAISQTFGGSSQLTSTAEHCFVLWTVLNNLITVRSAVVRSWEEPPSIWLTVAKNAFVCWALNLRDRMLLKGAVIQESNKRWWKGGHLITRSLTGSIFLKFEESKEPTGSPNLGNQTNWSYQNYYMSNKKCEALKQIVGHLSALTTPAENHDRQPSSVLLSQAY